MVYECPSSEICDSGSGALLIQNVHTLCTHVDKYGIIHSVARPLTEAGIDLLYLSTFSTANILVAEHRLSEAERILSGSGANTPENVASEDEDGEGDDV